MAWDQDQEWERDWWGNCANTYAEETKQLTYAHRMGLVNSPRDGMWPVYDLQGKSVLDIGGGPTSMLLRCVNAGTCVVADPCSYPLWTRQRYADARIVVWECAGEELHHHSIGGQFDEVWIYNVLQHTQDPERIIRHAQRAAPVIRIFEWIDIPPHPGHPQELKAEKLDSWLGGAGKVERMSENGCVGTAYYGRFDT